MEISQAHRSFQWGLPHRPRPNKLTGRVVSNIVLRMKMHICGPDLALSVVLIDLSGGVRDRRLSILLIYVLRPSILFLVPFNCYVLFLDQLFFVFYLHVQPYGLLQHL